MSPSYYFEHQMTVIHEEKNYLWIGWTSSNRKDEGNGFFRALDASTEQESFFLF